MFAGVIKNLEMGEKPELSRWALNTLRCILIREKQEIYKQETQKVRGYRYKSRVISTTRS